MSPNIPTMELMALLRLKWDIFSKCAYITADTTIAHCGISYCSIWGSKKYSELGFFGLQFLKHVCVVNREISYCVEQKMGLVFFSVSFMKWL